MLLLAGCGSYEETVSNKAQESGPFYYKRETVEVKLPESIHPYRIVYGENGLFGILDKSLATGADNLDNQFTFCYQDYTGSEIKKLCGVDGFVNAFYGESDSEIDLLFSNGKASLNKYVNGELSSENSVSGLDNQVLGNALLYRLSSGEYLIGKENKIYLVSADGATVKTITADGSVVRFLSVGDKSYAFTCDSVMKYALLKLDFELGKAEAAFDLSDGIYDAFSLADKIALLYQDEIVLADTNGENRERLISLDDYAIFASSIGSISGSKDAFRIIIDSIEKSHSIICMNLTKTYGEAKEAEKSTIEVVVPSDYTYDIEFHAKHYNQVADNSFIKIIRIDESIEDYLGKGARPDIIMFHDNLEAISYEQKNILTNLNSLMSERGNIKPDDIVPIARKMLTDENNDKMYLLAPNFSLYLTGSDGTEKQPDGTYNIIEYLEWFDEYLTNLDINGTCNLENLFYGILPDYYDAAKGLSKFTESEFKDIMRAYKEVKDHHSEELDIWYVVDNFGRPAVNIVRGPAWYGSYNDTILRRENCSLAGVPTFDGDVRAYTKLEAPMGILETSERKGDAYDFIAYYVGLNSYLAKGQDEADFGSMDLTAGRLSIINSLLDDGIFETSKPYQYARDRKTGEVGPVYYSEENLTSLRELIDNATPVDEKQDEIFKMFVEEMTPYIASTKDLDEACKVLDNRVSLYLMEKQ